MPASCSSAPGAGMESRWSGAPLPKAPPPPNTFRILEQQKQHHQQQHEVGAGGVFYNYADDAPTPFATTRAAHAQQQQQQQQQHVDHQQAHVEEEVDAWARAGAQMGAQLAPMPNRRGSNISSSLTSSHMLAIDGTRPPAGVMMYGGNDETTPWTSVGDSSRPGSAAETMEEVEQDNKQQQQQQQQAMRVAAAAASAAEVDALLTQLTSSEVPRAVETAAVRTVPNADVYITQQEQQQQQTHAAEETMLSSVVVNDHASLLAAPPPAAGGFTTTYHLNGDDVTMRIDQSPRHAQHHHPQAYAQETPLAPPQDEQHAHDRAAQQPSPPPANYLAAALAPARPKPATEVKMQEEKRNEDVKEVPARARLNKHGKPIAAFDPRKPKCALCKVNFTSEHWGKDPDR